MDLYDVYRILKREERTVLPLSFYNQQQKVLDFLNGAGISAEIVATHHKYADTKQEVTYYIRRIN